MHQLLAPPIPGSEDFIADHSTEEVLDRVGIDLDALALGDYHKPEEDVVDDVPVWYAGSTERCSLTEEEPRSVSLLEVEDGSIRRRKRELDTREFAPISIEFSEGDAHSRLNDVLDQYVLEDKVAHVTLRGERTVLTSSDVYSAVMDRGAAVAKIKDDRGRQELNLGDGPEGDIQNPDEIIDEQIANEGLSETALSIDERVRGDEGLPNSKDRVADEIEQDIKQAQDEAFSDDEADAGEEVAE